MISTAHLSEYENWIWNNSTGRDMMQALRHEVFERFTGGRPAPLHSWTYYVDDCKTNPDCLAKKYAIAYTALLTSSTFIDILNAADPAVAGSPLPPSCWPDYPPPAG